MKSNMTTKDLTTIGVCIAIAVVLGKVLGILHSVIPFTRGIINAPFYSFLIAVMLYRIRKPGTMIMFALGYGLTMSYISIFMSMAVIIGGIIGELIMLVVTRKYHSNFIIALCAPIYSVGGIIGTFFVVTFVVNSPRYIFEGYFALLISVISVYIAGLFGSFTAMKIMPIKLRNISNA
ncbi:MAG: hypothetical protein CVV02_11730 [Firmicutes bacterium HGW-Firmicutes-7]|nr:MAG: hypothetical protein CVV02_11730 [Firmicutes bacterium HGW-Firmicutes-7]